MYFMHELFSHKIGPDNRTKAAKCPLVGPLKFLYDSLVLFACTFFIMSFKMSLNLSS